MRGKKTVISATTNINNNNSDERIQTSIVRKHCVWTWISKAINKFITYLISVLCISFLTAGGGGGEHRKINGLLCTSMLESEVGGLYKLDHTVEVCYNLNQATDKRQADSGKQIAARQIRSNSTHLNRIASDIARRASQRDKQKGSQNRHIFAHSNHLLSGKTLTLYG